MPRCRAGAKYCELELPILLGDASFEMKGAGVLGCVVLVFIFLLPGPGHVSIPLVLVSALASPVSWLSLAFRRFLIALILIPKYKLCRISHRPGIDPHHHRSILLCPRLSPHDPHSILHHPRWCCRELSRTHLQTSRSNGVPISLHSCDTDNRTVARHPGIAHPHYHAIR